MTNNKASTASLSAIEKEIARKTGSNPVALAAHKAQKQADEVLLSGIPANELDILRRVNMTDDPAKLAEAYRKTQRHRSEKEARLARGY